MKIALICDMHMPENEASLQWMFFRKCIKRITHDRIDTVINLGDITSFGEYNVFKKHLTEMKNFKYSYILGNSDVRNIDTQKLLTEKSVDFTMCYDNRSLVGINTQYGKIEEKSKKTINAMSDGDILFFHNSVQSLDSKSQIFLSEFAEKKAITIIHAHSHKHQDYMLGKSHVIGLRAVDPDKSIGDYPCMTYLDTKTMEFTEVLLAEANAAALDASKFFGISCVDNYADVTYALNNNVYGIELRCNGSDWKPDLSLIPLINQWRAKTHGYLSVHMPNLKEKEGKLVGVEQWHMAVEYAKKLNADAMTMHPPRVKIKNLESVHDEFLDLYKYAVNETESNVKIGIENLHLAKGEENNAERSFGYIPEEISSWIDEINKAVGNSSRVQHTLDVGHARNNGVFAQMYPISRWYEQMGKKTVAYHIHQVIHQEGTMKNHTAIEHWFGPMISYASFFFAWEANTINHVPIFLEVRGCKNFEKSITAFNKTFCSG